MKHVRPPWSSALVIAAIALLGSLGAPSFAAARAERAKLAGRKPPSQYLYRLSVQFQGDYNLSTHNGESKASAWLASTSKESWLVRAGTTAKPSYTIASPDKRTPELLWMTRPLGYAGKAHFQFKTCTYDASYVLRGGKTASVAIRLSKNRLSVERGSPIFRTPWFAAAPIAGATPTVTSSRAASPRRQGQRCPSGPAGGRRSAPTG